METPLCILSPPGGPAAPFWGVVLKTGRVLATQIVAAKMRTFFLWFITLWPATQISLLFFLPPFGFIMMLTAVMIFPKNTYTPGPKDWETIEEYIYTEGDCLLQVLSDYVEAANRLSIINESKSKTVKWLQLFVLIFALAFLG